MERGYHVVIKKKLYIPDHLLLGVITNSALEQCLRLRIALALVLKRSVSPF